MCNSLSNRLLEIRKKLKITQKELANLTKVSQSNYSKYEKGIIEPSFSFITNIVNVLGISESWLISGEGEMLKQNNPVNGPVNSNTNNTSNPDIQQELISCQKELIQLRQQNSLLKEENKDLNTKIKEKLEKIIDLQDRLIKT